MSVQSLDSQVQKNIRRSNISAQQLMELAPAIKEADLRTTTEIILALPGETYQSHITSLKKLVAAEVDDIVVHTCMLLDGAEMSTPKERRKWDLKTKFRLLPRDFARLSNNTKNDATVALQLNGQDRFAPRNMSYFTQVQPYQHHTVVPYGDRIGVYSFALKPEEHQPSGSCNFSRIDNATLTLDFSSQTTTGIGSTQESPTDFTTESNMGYHLSYTKSLSTATAPWTQKGNIWIFAVNYNVLRIMSGMGGLAYSN